MAFGAVAAPLAALLALAAAYLSFRWRGEGQVYVIAPADGPVKIRLDGGPPFQLPAARLFGRELAPGDHTVELERDGSAPFERRVRIEHGGERWVVPAGDDQCFVEVDVTESAYGAGGAARIARRRGATPFRVSGSTYLRRSALPATRASSDSIVLLHPVRCDELALGDDALLARVPR